MDKWTKIPSDDVIKQTVEALTKNNIETFVVEDAEAAKKKFFELVPVGSEVFTNQSKTLDDLGINSEIDESGKYKSLRQISDSMPYETQDDKREFRRFRSAPKYAVGSAHAVTLDGRIMMASGSGSQIPGYAYGAESIVWIIGAQKLVKDIDEGIKRINEYCQPLESERVNKAYNTTSGSNARRILIFNSENDSNKNRTKAIIVKEVLGF